MRFCMVLRIHVCCRGEESVVMLPVVVLVCLISHAGNHLYVAEALIPDFLCVVQVPSQAWVLQKRRVL